MGEQCNRLSAAGKITLRIKVSAEVSKYTRCSFRSVIRAKPESRSLTRGGGSEMPGCKVTYCFMLVFSGAGWVGPATV